jgi:hypothetical protein
MNRRLTRAYPTLHHQWNWSSSLAVWFLPKRSSHGDEAGAHLRLLRLRAVGLRLCAPQTERAEHAAGSFSDWLRAALLLTPLASTVRLAVVRGSANSCLGAALVLAPLAATVRHAVGRAASSSCLEAALMPTPHASAMRVTVRRAQHQVS